MPIILKIRKTRLTFLAGNVTITAHLNDFTEALMDKTFFLNTFLEGQAVKNWLGDGSGDAVDKLVDKLLEALNDDQITKDTVSENSHYSSSHAKRVKVTLTWDGEECAIFCFDNSFKADFSRILKKTSRLNNPKLPLFCKCFAISVTSSGEIVEHLKSAMEKACVPYKDDISKALLYLYSGNDVPAATYKIGTPSTSDAKEDVIKTFCKTLFDKKPYTQWKFKREFQKACDKRNVIQSYEKIANNIVEKAKMHPAFELMFNDEESIKTYEDEIVTLLDTSTIYNPVSESDNSSDPFEGITVLSPYASFYNMLVKQQADAFFKLPPLLNQYHLTVLLGEYAISAMKDNHEFNAASVEKNSNFKNETFGKIYNATFEKREIIEKYIFEEDLKWFIRKGNNWRFSTAQHRLFFLASYDCLKYFLGELNENDLVNSLFDKLPDKLAENHLDRKFLTFLCYSFFLFFILSAKSVCLINKLIECADDYSVEKRNRQTAVLMLFSMLLSENYPASPTAYTELIDHSYGRAVYDYQLLVLETIKRKNPSHINYMKKKVYESLILKDDKHSEADPYFLLVASKIGTGETSSDDKKAKEIPTEEKFFLDCVKLHGQTWPAKNIPNECSGLVNGILSKLKESGDILKSQDNPHPAYVFGANLLFYSLANIQRVKANRSLPLFTQNYSPIYSALIYTDYHTRRLSRGYNKEVPSDFYILCGPYRFVCSARHPVDLKIKLDETMIDNYKRWYENEIKMSNNKSKRYLLLMTRLLSYTDFFEKSKITMPSKKDWENTKFLKYDNVPAISDDFVAKPYKLS